MKENNGNNHTNTPDYIAYNVQETTDGKGIWNRVGAAWEHRDGKGIELSLNSLPVNGRVSLRELRDERMNSYSKERTEQVSERQQESNHHYSRNR